MCVSTCLPWLDIVLAITCGLALDLNRRGVVVFGSRLECKAQLLPHVLGLKRLAPLRSPPVWRTQALSGTVHSFFSASSRGQAARNHTLSRSACRESSLVPHESVLLRAQHLVLGLHHFFLVRSHTPTQANGSTCACPPHPTHARFPPCLGWPLQRHLL